MKYSPEPMYSHVTLISRYPSLTVVNNIDHNMDVQYQDCIRLGHQARDSDISHPLTRKSEKIS